VRTKTHLFCISDGRVQNVTVFLAIFTFLGVFVVLLLPMFFVVVVVVVGIFFVVVFFKFLFRLLSVELVSKLYAKHFETFLLPG